MMVLYSRVTFDRFIGAFIVFRQIRQNLTFNQKLETLPTQLIVIERFAGNLPNI